MPTIYEYLLEETASGKRLVLATLVSTRGSTPQIPGASALFAPEGLVAGTLGGGVLESDAQRRALSAVESGRSLMYRYDMMADIRDAEGAICGGTAEVLIDADPGKHSDAFLAMQADIKRGRHGALLTQIDRCGGDQVSLARRWMSVPGKDAEYEGEAALIGQSGILESIVQRTPALFKTPDAMSAGQVEGSQLYVEPAFPLPQLIIVGAGHVGRSIAHYGKRLDFEVSVIDDRPDLANSDHIPDADHCLVGDIGTTVQAIPIRSDTYVVIVTRGHRGDAEALKRCIGTHAAYIGMIGSKRKIEQIREQFLEKGWATREQFDRICAPIGIDIDAKTVEEIGISVAAELVAVRRSHMRGEDRP